MMCEQCKPDDLLIPQMEPQLVPNTTPDPPPLPRGLMFWNESRWQDTLENAK